ncbi:MAG: hypothetical protein MUC49_02335 [Raineya sp.]|jgi:flagellar basal body-associated protein FliL|nr:hypothetical protein [Raineya sp.]
MRTIIILLAVLGGAFWLIKSSHKKEEEKKENFSGLVDGASSIGSSIVLLGFVVVGVIMVVGLVLLKKASENPEKSFEYAEKGANVYSKIKRA